MARRRGDCRNQRVRIVDVAALAGVSATTVSYVLNDRPHVSIPEETRARVWEAARQLGYAADPLARALRTGRTQMVGLVVSAIGQPFSVLVVQELQELVARDGWAGLIMDPGYGPTSMDVRSEALRLWPVDGIIAQVSHDWVEAFMAAHGHRRIPFVHLCIYRPVSTVDHVLYDLRPGALQAVRHLVEQGCRDIAFLAPGDDVHPGDIRYSTYAKVMAEAGLPTRVLRLKDRRRTREGARAVFAEVGAAGNCPDAVFCYNDDMALGVCRALRDLGRRIPEDTAVVGVDDLPESALACPSLSTVRIPVRELAETAWRFLRHRLDSPDSPPQQASFRTELIVRESSRR